MKLYYTKGACSLAVRIVLHEIKVDSEYEAVNLQTKQTEHDKDFLKINPKGSVPVILTDENEILTENSVILQYLADHYKNTELLPSVGNFKRYRVLEWLNFISTELHKSCGHFFNPTLSPDLKNNYFIPLLKNKLNFVDQHLTNHEYITNSQFTLADAYLFVILSWLSLINMNLADWQHLKKYYDHLLKRPSIRSALKEEGLEYNTQSKVPETAK